MIDYPLIYSILLVVFSAFIGGIIAKKFKQPVLLGYLLSGLLVSLIFDRLGLKRETLQQLAEVGLAFLMFTLGLEFHPEKLGPLKKLVIIGSFLQICLTIIFGMILTKFLFGFDFKSSFIISAAFSLSSTAVVVKILGEKHRLESLSGEIMRGWLLLQDLAVLPLIGLLPVLFGGNLFLSSLGMFKSILILLILFLTLKRVVWGISEHAAKLKSRELLILFVLVLFFLFGLLSDYLGFSFGLGAFLAGLLLGQNSASSAIFSEIRSLRDVFLVMFFVSLGLSLNPVFLFSNLPLILSVALVFLLLKGIVTAGILLFFKYHGKTVFDCSFGLMQIGEFSFVLASLALAGNFFGNDKYSLIVSVALLTMVITPWLFTISEILYKTAQKRLPRNEFWRKNFFIEGNDRLVLEEIPIKDHVVILGHGRVGKWISGVLEKAKIPYLVVEYNPDIVRKLKLEGKKVVFGDPTDLDVLDYAQVDKAKLVVIAIPDFFEQKMIIANCKTLNPLVKIICRSHFEENNSSLQSMGVDHIIQPEFEAALSIAHRALQVFGFDKEKINQNLRQVKIEHEG